jgi:hypothetical protein
MAFDLGRIMVCQQKLRRKRSLKMPGKTVAYILFGIGVLLLEIHTSIPFLWRILGLPMPYPFSQSIILYDAQGFAPIRGAFCLLAAGLVYEKLEITK